MAYFKYLSLAGMLVGLTTLTSAALFHNKPSTSRQTNELVQHTFLEPSTPETELTMLLQALSSVESNQNPRALGDGGKSIGLTQIQVDRARDLKRWYSHLPDLDTNVDGQATNEEIKNVLFDPKKNLAYARANIERGLEKFGSLEFAVAMHNTGEGAVSIARDQKLLNDLYDFNLREDGVVGEHTRKAVQQFQRDANLECDGKLGPNTRAKLFEVYTTKFPIRAIPLGAVPQNRTTPTYVANVFKQAEQIRISKKI